MLPLASAAPPTAASSSADANRRVRAHADSISSMSSVAAGSSASAASASPAPSYGAGATPSAQGSSSAPFAPLGRAASRELFLPPSAFVPEPAHTSGASSSSMASTSSSSNRDAPATPPALGHASYRDGTAAGHALDMGFELAPLSLAGAQQKLHRPKGPTPLPSYRAATGNDAAPAASVNGEDKAGTGAAGSTPRKRPAYAAPPSYTLGTGAGADADAITYADADAPRRRVDSAPRSTGGASVSSLFDAFSGNGAAKAPTGKRFSAFSFRGARRASGSGSSDDDGDSCQIAMVPSFASSASDDPAEAAARRWRLRPPPGVYEDRAPDRALLNDAQRAIADQFPVDVDDPAGSLIGTIKWSIRNWRVFLQWKYAPWYALGLLLAAAGILTAVYHKSLVKLLEPASHRLRHTWWGWILPVVVLFIVSFPPLFGHEIIAILCGIVWHFGVAFGIVCLGTLLGEIGNFYAFKTCLSGKAKQMERKSTDYACLAHIIREGGFMAVLMARTSAIPGHFTTAVFATVGTMGIGVFTLAAILTLPKQAAIVYVGVAIKISGFDHETKRDKIIKYTVLLVTAAVTVVAALYLYFQMRQVRPLVSRRLQYQRFLLLCEAADPRPEGEADEEADDAELELKPPRSAPPRLRLLVPAGGAGADAAGHSAAASGGDGSLGISASDFIARSPSADSIGRYRAAMRHRGAAAAAASAAYASEGTPAAASGAVGLTTGVDSHPGSPMRSPSRTAFHFGADADPHRAASGSGSSAAAAAGFRPQRRSTLPHLLMMHKRRHSDDVGSAAAGAPDKGKSRDITDDLAEVVRSPVEVTGHA